MNEITLAGSTLRFNHFAIVDGLLRENPYYVPPEKILGPPGSNSPRS